MNAEDEACIDDFIQTLHKISNAFNRRNERRLKGIRCFKEELLNPPTVPEHVEPELSLFVRGRGKNKQYRRLEGYSHIEDDGSIVIRLLSGNKIRVNPIALNYKAAHCYHLKLNDPTLSRGDLMGKVGYSAESSVLGGLKRVFGWISTGIVPEQNGITNITNEETCHV